MAVKNAIAFAAKSLGPERTSNIRLEEIESSMVDGKPVWLITLSGELHSNIPLAMFALGTDSHREYIVFAVDKNTGDVLSMKIRLLATPGA